MSDSKNFDRYLKDIDVSKKLEEIFNQLINSNISVITPEVYKLLSSEAVYLEKLPKHDETQIRSMKFLIMICNILYNRTDMLVLPVEDGVYDLLLEAYKKYDSNFQVGSAVVQFKTAAENINPAIKDIVSPLIGMNIEERDEMRQYIFEQLSSFDNHKFVSGFVGEQIIGVVFSCK